MEVVIDLQRRQFHHGMARLVKGVLYSVSSPAPEWLTVLDVIVLMLQTDFKFRTHDANPQMLASHLFLSGVLEYPITARLHHLRYALAYDQHDNRIYLGKSEDRNFIRRLESNILDFVLPASNS